MQWLPISERVPEKDGEYIVWMADPGHGIGAYAQAAEWYNGAFRECGEDRWFDDLGGVSHWMPMPEGPS